jgi:hypothetical protein
MKAIKFFCRDLLGVMAATALLSGAAAEPSQSAVAQTTAVAPNAVVKQPSTLMVNQELWRKAVLKVALPKKQGCFSAAYPNKTWHEAACVKAPNRPQPPQRGAKPYTVGNGTDWSVQVTSGHIASATGSFVSVTGLTSETGNGGAADNYTLQLNSDFFPSSACAASPNPGCRGWEQFVYSNSGFGFIQYWLIQYNTTCPAGWNSYTFGGGDT